jgi:amino acid adenylation domain-containing protein
MWPTTPPAVDVPLAGFRPVHERVDTVAERTPEAPAVSDDVVGVTYAELVSRSLALAAVLAERGAGPGATVAVRMPRSVAALVTLLAVSRTGAASLLLDPEGPPDWLATFVRSSSPCLCVEPQGAFDVRVGEALAVLEVTALGAAAGGPAALAWAGAPEVGPEHTACLVQTSGSTGMPKLVRVPHRTWTHAALAQVEHHRIGPQERGAWLFPPHTNVSASVVVWPFLVVGAHLSIPPAGLTSDPPALAAWIRDERVTQCFAVAPLTEALARLDWPPSSLRMLLTGSDRAREWGRTDLGFEIANWYGANEVNIVTSALLPWEQRITTHTASAEDRDGLVPIGRIWPGATFRVVSPDGEDVPYGEIGELLVGGSELALGYVSGRATADRFVPDPRAAEPGLRIYRTGDLVRQRADGAFEHCGRIDEQAKINGVRVELAEVEAALLSVPNVDEAVVQAIETPTGRHQLVGYVVSPQVVDATDLRDQLATRLPTPMVPTSLLQLPHLPRNQGDKIDRKALPLPWEQPEPAAAEPDPAVEPAQEQGCVALLMAEVLGIGICAPSDNFFLLGGDSMLAATFARQLTMHTGKQVQPRDVIERPVVSDLDRFVTAAPSAG